MCAERIVGHSLSKAPNKTRQRMNALEMQLNYPLGENLPESGKTIEIAPGVLWIRMGLPFALNHINLWLIEDHYASDVGVVHGWTAIDCGIANDATRDAWEILFGEQNRSEERRVGKECLHQCRSRWSPYH